MSFKELELTLVRARYRFASASSLCLGLTVGIAVTLLKLPLLFTTLGEQDHGRLIMDAVVYVHDGSATLRKYGIFTSPLWTLSFAGLAVMFDASRLVLLSNVGGWLCGGLNTALAFVLLRQLGVSRIWATSGALAAAVIPGTFYLSLYGYPSQYALTLLLASALAFARSLKTAGRNRWAWFTVAGIAYCGLALVKIDFALSGTFLLSVAIITGQLIDRRTALLPAFAVVAAGAAYAVSRIAIRGEDLVGFLKRFDQSYPWQTGAWIDASSATVIYACGFGTTALWVAALIAGAVMRAERARTIRAGVAWAIGVLPLWAFWLAHPPMSNRHAVPGALLTVLFAVFVASRVLRSVPHAGLVWLFALVTINWQFGEPNIDFNYRPSGNLARTISVNRRAFTVTEKIARTVVERREPIKVVLGRRLTNIPKNTILGGMDFLPSIEVAMASRARTVSAVTRWVLVFTAADGYRTTLVPYIDPVRASRSGFSAAGYYSPWAANLRPLTDRGLQVVSFDPDQMFNQLGLSSRDP